MDQVRADRVPPSHVPPIRSLGVVLIKEVVLPVLEHKAIGVIEPTGRGGEMELRPKGLGALEDPHWRQEWEHCKQNILSGQQTPVYDKVRQPLYLYSIGRCRQVRAINGRVLGTAGKSRSNATKLGEASRPRTA